MMTLDELKTALTERQEMQRIIDDAKAIMDARTDAIKAHMTEAGVDELSAGPFRVTWKYNKPSTVADVEKLKAAGLFDLYSKVQKPARPFKVN